MIRTAVLLLLSIFVSRIADAGADAEDPRKAWRQHTGSIPFVFGTKKGEARARITGRPAMYFLTEKNSRYSKRLAASAFVDTRIVTLVTARFTPILVDGSAEPAFRKRFGLEGTPWTIFTDRKGEKIEEVRGVVETERFLAVLTAAAKKVGEPKPSPEYLRLKKLAAELEAHVAKRDWSKAVRAILEIEEIGFESEFLEKALETKAELAKRAKSDLDRAEGYLDEGNPAAARKVLERIVRDYEGLPAATRAKELLRRTEDR